MASKFYRCFIEQLCTVYADLLEEKSTLKKPYQTIKEKRDRLL